jgi:uncharacterized protein YegL
MQGEKINALNAGMVTFKQSLMKDPLAVKRVEVAVITFDSSVKLVHKFVTVDQFQPPVLTTTGYTAMGSGIHMALDLLQQRKAVYKSNGVAYYRPWVMLITDGEPRGETQDIVFSAMQRLKREEQDRHVTLFAVGVDGANMIQLAEITSCTPIKLTGLNFNELFVWLSASMSSVAQQRKVNQISLPPPGRGPK